MGADYLVTNDLLVGLGAQFDWMDMDTTSAAALSGHGFMVGPYLTARLGEHFYLDARGAWGRSSNTVSPFGTYSDHFAGERWLATGALIGDFEAGIFTIRPETRLSWFGEKTSAYVDMLGVSVPSVSVSLGSFDFGPRVSTSVPLQSGSVLNPFVELKAVWDFHRESSASPLSSSAEPAGKLRGRVSGGASLSSQSGIDLNAGAYLDGIADPGFRSWGVQLGLNGHF